MGTVGKCVLYRGLAMFFSSCSFALPTAGEARAALESEDFTIKGIALGDEEKRCFAAFGKPAFDKERMVWDIHMRLLYCPPRLRGRRRRRYGQGCRHPRALSEDYTARAGVRYGAMSPRSAPTFMRSSTPRFGSVCLWSTRIRRTKDAFILGVDAMDGSLYLVAPH